MSARVVDQAGAAQAQAGQVSDEPAGAQANTTSDVRASDFESLLRGPSSPRPLADAHEPQPAFGADPAATVATAVAHSVATPAAPSHMDEQRDAPVIEADIDGRRVRIVAKDEIVLECGEASITLRRNGRIVIKGTYVETCSEGTNRIKGGQVRIN